MKSHRHGRHLPAKLLEYAALVVLVGAPGFAVHRLARIFEPGLVLAWAVGLPLLTYLLYATDKRRARDGAWRIPESVLHLFELLGGWPGAFLAQRRLRHKCTKGTYQFVFWLIVAAHEFVAIDWQLGWRLSAAAVGLLR